jgi:chaperonin GroES
MKVISNRVLIKLPDDAPRMAGGLHLPDEAVKDQFPEVKVIAIGPKVVDIKVGDTVLVDRYSGIGHRVTIKGITHIVFQETDILAIV